jgi:Transglutaminase-like superfamily
MQLTSRGLETSVERISVSAKTAAIPFFVQCSRAMVECWSLLFRFELVMRFRSSQALRKIVRAQYVRPTKVSGRTSVEALSHAMDLACVFYFKRVLCLQRSAATVVLLRRHGWNAEMVTGAQILPFEAHAWVEIANEVVNDKPYMHEIYQVLERY